MRLREPVRRDEAALRAFLADAQTCIVLPRRNPDTLSEKVRACLQRAPPAWPGLEAAASALHLSVSTLQRRLSHEGTSFQVLKDGLRRRAPLAK